MNNTNQNFKIDYDRTNILAILSENIEFLNNRVGKRIRNPETEKIKITQIKAVVYACKVYSDILKEKQIDEIEKELKLVKRAVEVNKFEEREKSKI